MVFILDERVQNVFARALTNTQGISSKEPDCSRNSNEIMIYKGPIRQRILSRLEQ